MIKITCDSACDLPQALSLPYRIQELPLGVALGDDRRQDRVNVDSQELYHYSLQTGILPEITPISKDTYRACFEDCIRQGYEVLHISLSSQLSDCCRNACAAAKDLPGVSIIDSESISAGAGQLALLAAELASADYRLMELTDAINEMKAHLDVSCVLQSSEFLHKKGKRGGLAAFGQQLLKLKPEITLKKGLIHQEKTFRGDLEQSILSYVRSRLAGRKNIQTDRIFVTYSGVPRSILDKVTELLHQLQPFEQILEVPADSVVSCRCGPGSLGLSFMTI